MKTERFKNLFLVLCFALLPMAMMAKQEATVSSPSGNLTLTAGVDNAGRPYYSLRRGGEVILLPSALGMKLKDGSLENDFRVVAFARATKDETWRQPWGEEVDVRNPYNELTMKLAQKKGLQRQLNIVFRVFDDGMGFRYVFPEQKQLKDFVIMDEATEFCFKGDPEAWTLPYDAGYYEGLWTKDHLSKKGKVCTPVTIEAKPDLYMMLHEANLTDYSSLNVKPVETKDGSVKTNYYDYLYNHQKESPYAKAIGWIGKKFSDKDSLTSKTDSINPFMLNKKQDEIFTSIKNSIACDIDIKTGLITISVEDQDPLISATIADSVRAKLQDFITNYKTNKMKNDVKYYTKLVAEAKKKYEDARQKYATFSDANQDVILQELQSQRDDLENDMQLKFNAYSALSTQLQNAQAKLQEHTPSFTIVQSASVPVKPAGPKRMAFVFIVVFLSMMVTFVICNFSLLFGGAKGE